MAQTQPNHPLLAVPAVEEEMSSGLKEWAEQVMPHMPPEQRLVGLTPAERLVGLSAEELAQLTGFLNLHMRDWLRKVAAKRVAMDRLLRRVPGMAELAEMMWERAAGILPKIPLLQRVAGLTAEDRLLGLSPVELNQLKALLNNELN